MMLAHLTRLKLRSHTPRVALLSSSLLSALTLLSACATRPPPTDSAVATTPLEAERPPPRESLIQLSEERTQEVQAHGLTLHLQRRARAPLVSIQLWLSAGAQREREGALGAATLLQHLIIGDEHNPKSLKARLTKLGAKVSAWTSVDRTVLELSALPERVEEAVATLAEVVLSPDWSEEQLERARERTLNQQLKSRQWAGRRLLTRLVTQSYHGHVNGRLVLPSPEHISALKLQDVQRFYKDNYQPHRAHFVCIGNFQEELLRGWFEERWRPWHQAERSADVEELPPYPSASLSGPEVEVELAQGGLAQLSLAFPVPHLTPESVAYLDLTSLLLVGDRDGLLYQAARRVGVDIKEARAFPITPDGPGAFIVSVELSAAHLDAFWGALMEQLNELRTHPPELRRLEQAKLLFERESAQTRASLAHQARRLGFFLSRWPNANALSRYGRALAQTRPQDLQTYLKDLLTPKHLHSLVRSPAPQELEPSLWAERLRERAVQVMSQRGVELYPGLHQLDDQLTLLYEPSEVEGVVSLSLSVPVRPTLKRGDNLSLGHWLAAQMSERQPYEPYMKASFHHESLELNATIASSQLDEALSAMLRRVRSAPLNTEPAWSSDALERARVQAMGALELRRHQPWLKLAFLEERAALAFDHGVLASPRERLTALKEQSATQLARWYQEHVQNQPALLVVTGDMSRQALSSALRPLVLSERGERLSPTEGLKRAPRATTLKRCRAIHETNDRTEAWLGLRFQLLGLEPRDLPALALLEASLTTPQGLAYQALTPQLKGSPLRLMRSRGAQSPQLSLWLNTTPSELKGSFEALNAALETLKNTPLTSAQLAELKRAAKAQQAHSLSHLSARAQWLGSMWFLGWRAPEDSASPLKAWWGALEQVSAQDLQRVTQAVMSFEGAVEALWAPPSAEVPLKGCTSVTL